MSLLERVHPTAATSRSARPTVRDLMEPATVTMPPDAHMLDVAEHLRAFDTHAIVIVNGTRPLGVITSRDIARYWASKPGAAGTGSVEELLPGRTRRLLPGLDISVAAAVLDEENLEAAPVVDWSGDLVGVLAVGHIVAALTAADPCR